MTEEIQSAATAASLSCDVRDDGIMIELRDKADTAIAVYHHAVDGAWRAEVEWDTSTRPGRWTLVSAPTATLALRRACVRSAYADAPFLRPLLLPLLRELRTEPRRDRYAAAVRAVSGLSYSDRATVACAIRDPSRDPVDSAREIVRAIVALDPCDSRRSALAALEALG